MRTYHESRRVLTRLCRKMTWRARLPLDGELALTQPKGMAARFHRARLKDARLRAGLTQAELARRIGISRHFVLEVENGHRDPGYATMEKWLRALGANASLDLFRQLSRKIAAPATKVDSAEVA